MTAKEAFQHSSTQLRAIYEVGEADSIAKLVIEKITGLSKAESDRNTSLSDAQQDLLQKMLQRLGKHEPVQYVLEEAWFCGLKFYVNENVLIPRPETEELVEWIISNCRFPVNNLQIIDIGSGSGCIPVTLKRRIRKAAVWGLELSPEALDVARKNADNLGTEINWRLMNFLKKSAWDQLPQFDIIISNPPYITLSEKTGMDKNVADFEPSLALFVPDNDPLLFYRMIAKFGKDKLMPGGAIYLEMHALHASAVNTLMQAQGYTTEIKNDMQGKPRMLKASL